ncbi:peptidase [Cellulomonas sp. P5_C6]
MARFIRGALVALIAVLVGLGGALPSNAAAVDPSPAPSPVVYGCLQPQDAYGVPQVCQLSVHTLTPVCDKDVPKLRYDINAQGTPNTKVTITWINPTGGPNVVYADQPLSGTVLWPGAVEGPDGHGIDWPGWRQLPDGTWVEGDEFDWVRPNVNVLFQVNPEATVTVAYPPSSPTCLTNPPDEEEVLADNPEPASNSEAAVLSSTGSDAGPLVIAGAGLIVVGALVVALVAIARRRRTSY